MSRSLITQRDSWRKLFEQFTLDRSAQLVTIDVLNEDLGDQTEATRMPLLSLDYDDRSDVVIVTVGTAGEGRGVLRHLIHDPTEVDVLERADASVVVRIVDQSGTETLVTVEPRPSDD